MDVHFVGRIFAALVPFVWVASPYNADALKGVALLSAFIGFSCYLGIKARRRGREQPTFSSSCCL
jgi:hypothetical protein